MSTRKEIADLADDRAAERALNAKVVYPHSVKTDADYLRNDGADILRVLDAEDPVFNVIAPRRWGKTSFLSRVLRHAKDRQRLACYANFTSGLDTVQSELAEYFGVEPKLASLRKGIRQATERPIILLDEGNKQVQEDSDEGDASRSLLTLLATLAVDERRIVLCLAETSAFFHALSYRGEGLEVLVSDNPIYLRQIPNAAKDAFLDPLRKSACSKVVDEIGAVPIEVQLLKKRYSWLVDYGAATGPTKVSDVDLRDEFGATWGDVLDLILPSLDDDEKAVMWECSVRGVAKHELKKQGLKVARRLAGRTGWGLLKQGGKGRYVAAGELSGEFVEAKIATPAPGIRDRLFRVKPSPAPRDPTPKETFKDGFIIHQISDLHFGRFSKKSNGRNLADYYVEYLTLEDVTNPHMIVICGDLTSIGDAREFLDAQELIRNLRRRRTDDGHPLIRPLYHGSEPDFRKQILLVPGNHDVQWPKNRSYSEGPSDTFNTWVKGQECVTPQSNVPAVHIAPVNVTLVACDSAHRGGEEVSSHLSKVDPRFLREDMRPVLEVLKELQGTLGEFVESVQNSDEHDDADLLRFYTLFTWGLVDNGFLDRLPQTLKNSRETSKIDVAAGDTGKTYGAEVCIGVLHHNLSPFAEIALFNDLLNSRKVRNAFVSSGINIILHGHTHQYSVTSEMAYEDLNRFTEETVAKTLHCVGVDSLGIPSQNRLSPSFNEIKVHCDEGSVDTRKVNVRRVEFEVDGGGRVGRIRSISSADINVETPKVRS